MADGLSWETVSANSSEVSGFGGSSRGEYLVCYGISKIDCRLGGRIGAEFHVLIKSLVHLFGSCMLLL